MELRMEKGGEEEVYVSVPADAFHKRNETMIEGEDGFTVVPGGTPYSDTPFAFRVKRPNGTTVPIDAYAVAEHGIVFRIGTAHFYWDSSSGKVYVLDNPKTLSGETYTFKVLKEYDGFQVEMRELTPKEREKLDTYKRAGIIKS